MDNTVLYAPVFVQIGLSLLILLWLAYSRVSRVAKQGIAEIRKTGFPTHVVNAGDNFKNQFEIPVLFYVLCLFFIVSGHVTPFIHAVAWVFVIARILHAAMQLTKNIIFPYRFGFFLISALSVIVLLVCAVKQLGTL